MGKINRIVRGAGEPLLWLGFLGGIVACVGPNPPENAVAVTGLFALAAIGVRATRQDMIPSDVRTSGE
jgi:hypothetical protein